MLQQSSYLIYLVNTFNFHHETVPVNIIWFGNLRTYCAFKLTRHYNEMFKILHF
jgi:hypothetical protein